MKASGRFKPAVTDLAIAGLVFLLLLAGFAWFDVFEIVFKWTRESEDWELDELVAVVPALAFAAAWYAYRRWRESERLSATLMHSVEKLEFSSGNLRAAHAEAERTKAALFVSQQALAQAHRVARLAHWRWSFAAGRLTEWSEEFPQIFGVTDSEIDPTDEGQLRFVHRDDRAALAAVYLAATPENPGFEAQYRVVRSNGEVRYIREVAEPEVDEAGRVVAHFGIIQDITELRKTEEALSESERRYRSLYYSTPAMMHSIDINGRLLSVSDYWLQVMGYERQEVVGRELAQFMTDASADYARLVGLPEFRRTGQVENVAYHFIKKGGAVIETELSAITERDQDGQFVRSLAVVIDVTERNRAEAKLRRAQRLEAVGQLTGGVAHDFNNLLAGILLNLGFLKGDGEDDDRNSFVEQIEKAIGRGRALTDRLLAFSRKQPLSPIACDVARLIEDLGDMLRLTLGSAITLDIKHGDDLWPAMVDPSQFDNALVNLAINARDAMPNGGCLTVETANVTVTESKASDEITPGDYVSIVVGDTGDGMPPEVLTKAFEPFFTTKNVGQGSGLGLSMVYGFVKQSKGHVAVDSKPGQGTRVTLCLPKAEAIEAKQADGIGPTAVAAGSERILMVEDNPALRHVSVRVLRDAGYEVADAADAQQALDHLRAGSTFDLLLTDIMLPGGMNGAELAAEARRLQPGIKALFVTGYAENLYGEDAPLDPGMRLLRKPFAQDELLVEVRQFCDRRPILLVEDEEAVRESLAKALENAGYSVTSAINGVEAIGFMETQDFDIVVTDIVMDEGEGVEIMARVREHSPETPVIAISGYPTYLRTLKTLGAAATLSKPFEAQELLALMSEVAGSTPSTASSSV